jgi:hypothetical protein
VCSASELIFTKLTSPLKSKMGATESMEQVAAELPPIEVSDEQVPNGEDIKA